MKRKFGNTDMEITTIGLGAWAIGGPWQWGWGAQDDKESIKTIQYAVDLGINWIDTAAVYGLGHSEEIVSEALKGITNKPYIFTKCSLIWNERGRVTSNLNSESIRREIEESLIRLNVEIIDLYQIHWPNPDEKIEEGWETLAKLKEEGKVRWIGVSNFDVQQMTRVSKIAPISSLQPPYSAIKRDIEDQILPYCSKNNVGVIVYSPMQAGLLTGKMTRDRIKNLPPDDWRKNSTEFNEPNLTKNLALQDLFVDIAKEFSVPAPVISIAWTLYHPDVTAAIVGARKPAQLNELIKALEFQLNGEIYQRINEFIKTEM